MARLIIWLLLCCLGPFAASAAALEEARQTVADVAAQIDAARMDGDRLAALRVRIDPFLIDLRADMRALDARRAEAKHAAELLGPRPAAGQPGESAAIEAQRKTFEAAAGKAEAEHKEAQLVLAAVEATWNKITELRRDLFLHRVFARSASPLTLQFWHDLVALALPLAGGALWELGADWSDHLDRPGGWLSLAALLAIGLALVVAALAAPAQIERLLARFAPKGGGPPDRAAIARHGLIALVAGIAPVPLALECFKFANLALDAAPGVLDDFVSKVILCAAGVMVVAGVLRVLLSPANATWRILRCTDRSARRGASFGIWTTVIYAGGIALAELASIMHLMVVITQLQTLLVVVLCAACIGGGLLRLAIPSDAPQHGLVAVPLGWMRPLAWLLVAASLALSLAGYIALGGFLMGRLIGTAAVLALALVVWILIDALFEETFSRANPATQKAAAAAGVSPGLLEIAGTLMSGTLRLGIAAFALFMVFGPWHLEYGDANPFEDVLFGFSLNDIRLAFGSVGFALLAFALGIAGTRLVVGWFDVQLLPRTALDQGVRNSITTILGYGGFAVAAAVCLSLLGINPQNLAVVAGALSVGIGFGLQSIVSNFVSGLIILAERPIRVGDVISVKGESGTVKKISVRSTLIRTPDRADLVVPNTDLITSIVRNRTFSTQTHRLGFTLLLDHDSDPDAAHDLLLSVIYHHPNILKDPMPTVFFDKATLGGLELEIKGVVDKIGEADKVRSELLFHMHRLLRAQGIRLGRMS